MSSAPQYRPHYTVADYRQWPGDWELWSGVPVAMTPSPFGPHQAVAARLARLLGNELERVGCDCEVLHEIDWLVSDDTVVRPDVLVLCGELPPEHVMKPPVLIAEVISPSTAAKDREAKYELYRQQGVDHYLILHPTEQTLEAYQRTAAGRYAPLPAAASLTLPLHPDCTITLDVSKLFPPQGRE